MAVVLKVSQLVGPLGDYSQSVLQERYDNEETTNGGEVAASCCQHFGQ